MKQRNIDLAVGAFLVTSLVAGILLVTVYAILLVRAALS